MAFNGVATMGSEEERKVQQWRGERGLVNKCQEITGEWAACSPVVDVLPLANYVGASPVGNAGPGDPSGTIYRWRTMFTIRQWYVTYRWRTSMCVR